MQTSDNKSASITIRMDAELKRKAERLYEDMGLNMTTAITMFTKAVVREGKIPFEVKADSFWGTANQEILRKRAADMDAGHNTHMRELPEARDE